jgi:DNA-binding transcriptional LysR family regulator
VVEDWDDIRVFLAVARQGGLANAAQSLGVNHTTVARRLSNLEFKLGARLAVRTTTGITLTLQGEALFRYAERIEAETLAFEQHLISAGGTISGKVRLGTREGFGSWLVCPKIPALMKRHPDLMLELVSEARVVNLLKGDADVTVTLSYPSQNRIVVQKLTEYRMGLFASHSYLEAHGPINTIEDLRDQNVIWYIDDVIDIEEQRYLQSIVSIAKAGFRASNILAQYEVAARGGAVGMFPVYKAGQDPNLVRILPDEVEDKRSYWLSVHPDSQHVANVRAIIEFLIEIVREQKDYF